MRGVHKHKKTEGFQKGHPYYPHAPFRKLEKQKSRTAHYNIKRK